MGFSWVRDGARGRGTPKTQIPSLRCDRAQDRAYSKNTRDNY